MNVGVWYGVKNYSCLGISDYVRGVSSAITSTKPLMIQRILAKYV